ncbi:RecF/RecN/SMC [Daedaleopsis nitida]|nr:RecF/RecN/SMC [Daedaleopsis nitida]
MHIQGLIVDGFKSYPVKTRITGWDPSFNAITGLNGSGKSNILDAICFVLGLTYMASMHAQSQQDLIYKRGQSSVTKASVTIIFDNTDSATSPFAIKECAGVIVTRQVLNMRTKDILGMIEEAAGTRMYDKGKETNCNEMAKKDMKVRELQDKLDERVIPKIAKLREEKQSYLQWQRTCTELERMGRTLRAYEYTESSQCAIAKQREIAAAEREVTALKKDKGRYNQDIKAAQREMHEINRQSEYGKHLAKVRTQVELKNGAIEDEEGKIAVSQREQVQELRAALQEKLQQQVEKLRVAHTFVQDKWNALETALNNTDGLLQSLLVIGLSLSNNGANTGCGYMGQISEAEERKAHAGAEEQQARVQLGMKGKELADLEGRFKNVERVAKDGARILDSMLATVDGYKKRKQVRHFAEVRDAVKSRVATLDFEFDPPYPTFDRNKVKGLVASLVQLDQANYNVSTALEITAGGRLYNVVVESDKHTLLVKTHQKELQTASLESEQMQQDIARAEKDIDGARVGVEKLQKQLEKLEAESERVEALAAEAAKNLAEERATLNRYDEELKSLHRVVREKKQAISDTELQITKREHEVSNLGKEKTAAENAVANLEKQYEWIIEERGQFGRTGTPYDFKKELEATQMGIKRINPKAAHMLEDIEKREAEVTQNLQEVYKNKKQILETLENLDRAKREAVEKTWTKVNDDFGTIFAELLPGNFAKLEPPDGQDLMQGLEVKVRLGTVWKQSLTELSGGQRSLIALSLIMSLLQFKPAPMYILDEIDAALDPSHTQHIGQLFRTRFKGAQFIVVSLKEGLFAKANVLFRTRFRDGTSVVERTADRSTGVAGHPHAAEDEENVPAGGRRARNSQ